MCGTVSSLADVIAQTLFDTDSRWDMVRTVRFGCVGAFYAAPVMTWWYRRLDRIFGASFSWRKLATDQILMNPALTVTRNRSIFIFREI